MAVGTGMGTGAKKTGMTQQTSSLSEEQKALVAKAKRPVDIANKFRLGFLFIAVLLLLFVYFGGKLWEGVLWFDNAVQNIYNFLLWDILLMLLATFVKFFFAARYNHVVRKL